MKKLRLHLKQFKNTIEMRVLEQEGIDSDLSEFVRASADYEPDLYIDFILLRGSNHKHDYIISCLVFDTEEETLEHLNKIVNWLDEVFYPNGNKELQRGDTVIAEGYTRFSRYFIADLGADIEYGRYVTAKCFQNGKYSDIELWNGIAKTKKTGYNKETNEYYGEIE